ncbi:hypothetical protein NYE67_20600 [Solibacillus sp. FSL W8-0474]|uniref:hypothetical protein n=1 Tax=Solibacillus sp. FSL W8-0474 TaxID=2975336 RepID=UPI0030F53853
MQGWIKDFRQELDSDIWAMPPIYHRVWQYIKYMANHNDNTIPMRDGSKLEIKRGQHLTSVRTIAGKVGWYERGIYKEPNPKTIQSVLDWLEQSNMIYTDKSNRKYTLITVVNWDIYQGDDIVKVTESNSGEVTKKKQSADINKNEKNEKNLSKDYTEQIKNLLSRYSDISDFININKQYWDVIRETRANGKVAPSVIYNTMTKWVKYDPIVVYYAIKTHTEAHAGKKEAYTIGIMRGTTKDDAEDKLNQPRQLAIGQPIKQGGFLDLNLEG